jgi:hypothetical protein
VVFEPPPPHAGARIINVSKAIVYNGKRRLSDTPASTTENRINPPNASQRSDPGRLGNCNPAAVAAVVLTVSVEETGVEVNLPVALIEAGLNEHAAPAGSPEHAREIVPLKPVE